MITISEHTIEESIIKKNGFILDIGCVNFTFSLGVKKYCDNIICIDPNSNILSIPEGLIYEKSALISGDDKSVEFFIYNDIQGYSILNPQRDWCQLVEKVKVDACNLQDIMSKYNIEQFDLIKLDIEGAEYDVLDKIDWTVSKQYSVEFHDFRNMNPFQPNNEVYYSGLFSKMLKYCDIIK